MIALIDYGAGNLTSVSLALKEIGQPASITANPDEILSAERCIFPGVGAAGAAMQEVQNRKLKEAITQYIRKGKPFLGICVGAQILLDFSEENEGTSCLGIIPGKVKKFLSSADSPIKIPQMGWNQVRPLTNHPLFEGIPAGAEFYFVHSYYPSPERPQHVFAETTYGANTFASVFGSGNCVATQFHPEKSGRVGLKLIENFLNWDGAGPA